jgi:putative ubiquitin-RnfH superfamily antitoxin RatB of RatAB toxin-antitoxin module
MQITLVYSPGPREIFEETMTLPDGATARDAVIASKLAVSFPTLDWDASTASTAPTGSTALTAGIWGRGCEWDQVLTENDRVELCRPLKVDPKVARRERFQRQGARGTGLFASRRQGGKAGY